ncbi:MAG: DNA topoisomerase, partial [Patescibacteria group bacterium]
ELPDKLTTKESASKFLNDCIGATFTIRNLETKPSERNPSAPFTTSTLQQEASRKLGYSVKQTMTLAQRLYESGHITYMRTDSTILSGQAIAAAKDYIIDQFGANYHNLRQFKTKNSSAQEAHEAIRPTNFTKTSAGSDEQQKKLYQLIWKRALASQMASAKVDRTEANITISSRKELLIAKGEMLKFDGFFKVYGGGKDDVILPPLTVGQKINLVSLSATQNYSRPPARYSEAALVKKLEELGIGRPSTYAPTISTIQTRGYIEKVDIEGSQRDVHIIALTGNKISEDTTSENYGADKNKLLPTPLADVTTDFLVKHFASIVDYDFTARVEQEFDDIADGKEQWQDMISDFYKNFHPLIESSDDISRSDSMQARELGTDPTSGKPIFARYGKYGPMLQKGETKPPEGQEDVKPDFAPMPDGASITTVTLAQALEMFKLPRVVGKTDDGQEIKANIGRFGPYIQVGKLFVSIKPHDPMKVTLEEALELYTEKLEKEKNKYIAQFASGIQIINGPYGPYITDGKKNARIPKDTDPKKLTEKECKDMLAKAPAKKKFVRRKKK